METIENWANDPQIDPRHPKMQSRRIRMKIGKETKFGTINLNIRVLKLENKRKMGY